MVLPHGINRKQNQFFSFFDDVGMTTVYQRTHADKPDHSESVVSNFRLPGHLAQPAKTGPATESGRSTSNRSQRKHLQQSSFSFASRLNTLLQKVLCNPHKKKWNNEMQFNISERALALSAQSILLRSLLKPDSVDDTDQHGFPIRPANAVTGRPWYLL